METGCYKERELAELKHQENLNMCVQLIPESRASPFAGLLRSYRYHILLFINLHKSFGLWTYPGVLRSYYMPLSQGLAAKKELAVSMLEMLNSDVGFLKRDYFSGYSTRRGALIVAIIISGHLVLNDVT